MGPFLRTMQVLERMEHRGGCGCEVNTGDGSGILLAIPDGFYRNECKAAGVELPPDGRSHARRACVRARSQQDPKETNECTMNYTRNNKCNKN